MKAAYSVLLLAALIQAATCLFMRIYIHVRKPLSWTEAQTYCRTEYVDLLTIETPEGLTDFNNAIMALQTDRYWIGLSKRPEASLYTTWSDGSKLRITNWNKDKPLKTDTEHCVTTINGLWTGCDCENLLWFFCYTWEPQIIVVQEMKTWLEALEHCRTYYTDLISLTTQTDLFVANNKSLNISTPSVWTGLRFLDGSWFWVNKEPLGNLPSLPLCPARPFLCGARKAGADVLENRDCNEKMNFICYR